MTSNEILQQDLLQLESSQRSHDQMMFQESRMNVAIETEEYNLFSLLNPEVYMDGNMYCVHYGKDRNPMEAVQGFGETVYLAILDFNKSFHTKIRK